MTRKQERVRARRRYEKQQVARGRRVRDEARLAQLGRQIGIPLLVAAVVLAILGVTFSAIRPGAQRTVAGCKQPPPVPGTTARLRLPDTKTVAGKTYLATVTTTCGDIELELDGAKAPQAVASFVQLAGQQYWRDAPCHRLLASPAATVLQCGDPTGAGSGTPGYGFGVENAPADNRYPRGTLAMARTSDPKKGNGGQFFVVDKDSTFPPNGGTGYTVFGAVVSGLDIVDRIVAAGVAPGSQSSTDGAPAAPISILRVAVTEKKA